tara:strand:- start:2172 stop:2543 length:372 start_codon:yes stop_codon:yes gene_type:complete
MIGSWILGSLGFAGVLATAVVALNWLLRGHRETVELLIKNNTEISEIYKSVTNEYLDHLKNAAPIGGLPRELWLEQHDLKKKEQLLRERQLDVETPLRRAALENKLRQQGKLTGGSRVRDPEA